MVHQHTACRCSDRPEKHYHCPCLLLYCNVLRCEDVCYSKFISIATIYIIWKEVLLRQRLGVVVPPGWWRLRRKRHVTLAPRSARGVYKAKQSENVLWAFHVYVTQWLPLLVKTTLVRVSSSKLHKPRYKLVSNPLQVHTEPQRHHSVLSPARQRREQPNSTGTDEHEKFQQRPGHLHNPPSPAQGGKERQHLNLMLAPTMRQRTQRTWR